jgi:hypothetical protein
MAELHRPRDEAVEEIRQPLTGCAREGAAEKVGIRAAVDGLRAGIVRRRQAQRELISVQLHRVFTAGLPEVLQQQLLEQFWLERFEM